MLIDINKAGAIFLKIIKKAHKVGSASSVAIFVANDCDALCAAKIITYIFQQENIAYFICPVTCFTELENQIKELEQRKDEVIIN